MTSVSKNLIIFKAEYNTQAKTGQINKGRGIGKHSKGVKILRVGGKGKGKRLYRKGNKPKITSGSRQRSFSTIGIHDELICLFDFSACVDFCVLFLFCCVDQLVISSLWIWMELIK